MRKVIFTIDDLEYFKRSNNLTEEQLQDIFGDKESFKVIYTLYGEGNCIDRYTLTDFDGNKVNLNDLNGYQKGVVLNDCMAYFNGGKYHSNGTEPCGVIDIQEIQEEKIYRIGKYDKHDDGKFYFTEEKTTDSPYWKVIDGVIYYVFGTGKHGVDYKEKLNRMPMSETEATENNCYCYYKILE